MAVKHRSKGLQAHTQALPLWIGTEAAYDIYFAAVTKAAEFQAAHPGSLASMKSQIDDMVGPLLTVQDGVGVISISGSLVAGEAGFMRLFGTTGYDDIRGAVDDALADKNVKSIMLHVASGGGQVDGVEDLGQHLQLASASKPMSTFADGVMASAAYWLGSYGGHISTTKTSVLGSLGVYVVHWDRTEQMKQDGVKPTLVRSGQYKALANPVEPLSEKAKAQLQDQVDTVYGVFMDTISANRGVSYQEADKKMGEGREFMGADAVKAGLADTIANYGQAHLYAKSLDKSSNSQQTPANPKQGAIAMKIFVTAEQLAALANGKTRAELGIALEGELALAEAEANLLKATPAADLISAQAQVKVLEGQLSTTNDKLVKATADLTTLTANHSALSGSSEALTALARADVNALSVALGGAGTVADGMDSVKAVAEHARLLAEFNTKFPGGRITRSTQAVAKTGDEVAQAHNPAFAAMVASSAGIVRTK